MIPQVQVSKILAAALILATPMLSGPTQAQQQPSPSGVAKAAPGIQAAIDQIAKAQDAIGKGDWNDAQLATGNARVSLLNTSEIDQKDERLQQALTQLREANESVLQQQGQAANNHLSAAVAALAAAPGSSSMTGSSTPPQK